MKTEPEKEYELWQDGIPVALAHRQLRDRVDGIDLARMGVIE